MLPAAVRARGGTAYVNLENCRTCWVAGCSKPVGDVDEDDLGLCEDCIASLRASTNEEAWCLV